MGAPGILGAATPSSSLQTAVPLPPPRKSKKCNAKSSQPATEVSNAPPRVVTALASGAAAAATAAPRPPQSPPVGSAEASSQPLEPTGERLIRRARRAWLAPPKWPDLADAEPEAAPLSAAPAHNPGLCRPSSKKAPSSPPAMPSQGGVCMNAALPKQSLKVSQVSQPSVLRARRLNISRASRRSQYRSWPLMTSWNSRQLIRPSRWKSMRMKACFRLPNRSARKVRRPAITMELDLRPREGEVGQSHSPLLRSAASRGARS